MPSLNKHTLPRLTRSTLNELQQNQHEKVLLVCVCTEPVRTGIGAVCVEYGLLRRPITMLNHTDRHPWYRKIFLFFIFFGTLCSYDPLWRGFFAWRQNSLGRFAPSALPHYNSKTQISGEIKQRHSLTVRQGNIKHVCLLSKNGVVIRLWRNLGRYVWTRQ